MNSPLVQLNNVHKKFYESSYFVHILKGVNLSIEKGQVVGLLGESGVGKSTLLHVMGLLDTITSGEVFIDEMNLTHFSEQERTCFRRQHVGFIYQKHYLLSEFNVLENVMMPLLIQGMDKKEAEFKSTEMLEKVSLSHRLKYSVLKLSGGEQQRVSVARALVKKPKILLADEPTGNLDEDTGNQVFDLFLGLAKQQNVTTFMVTHNKNLTRQMDRVLLLEDGVVKEQ